MNLLGILLVNTLTLFVVSYILPGFEVSSLTSALVASVVIGVVNTFVKPILKLITLPLTFLTLGLWSFVVNVLLLMAIASIVPGFAISGFWTAALASILLSLVGSFLGNMVD